jgi:thioredoxin reductase
MTDVSADRYCVIGAGAAGLTAAKNLREHGFGVDVYELAEVVGGNWNIAHPYSRVYESTHTISSPPFTQYPDFPMPDSWPDYPHHRQIGQYLERYARHFGLLEVTRFSTEVERVEPVEGGRSWDVTVRSAGADAGETLRYAGVVICNGHNWHPKLPAYPGEFAGETIHSAEYKSADVLRGKRVLVVGGGNTGCDIAVEAAQTADAAFHSTRRGYWYAPKYNFGKPSDQISDVFFSLRLPTRLIQMAFETTLKLTTGDLTRHGLPKPDHRILETHPINNSQLVYYVGHGDITPKRDIASLDGDSVRFVDGSAEQVDLIIWATGYLMHFAFIDAAHLNWHDGRPHLYLNAFPPDYDNLFVIGLLQPDSGLFALMHWQAQVMARFLCAQTDNPDAADRFRRLRDAHLGERRSGGVHYTDSTRHHLEIEHMDYMRGLADLVHVLEPA